MSAFDSCQPNVYEIDPTSDFRWDSFVQAQPDASMFHTQAWLEALRDTYGYRPRVVTTSAPGSVLTNGIPFCEINGFFGKRRLVSLPFSDHCQPLVQNGEQLERLTEYLEHKQTNEKWDYVELRPHIADLTTSSGFTTCQAFVLHKLDLRRNLQELFAAFHKDCVQRKIRRAEKEALSYEEGTSQSLLRRFYQLQVVTRQRHGVPAQPVTWFVNLLRRFGSRLTISAASLNGQAVAAIITVRHNQTLVYKYGCSDHRFSNLGGMQLLFWRAIQRAKRDRLTELDLGRCDLDNPGLIAFKNRWGAQQSRLEYLCCGTNSSRLADGYPGRLAKYICSHAPKVILTSAGRAFYRHLG